MLNSNPARRHEAVGILVFAVVTFCLWALVSTAQEKTDYFGPLRQRLTTVPPTRSVCRGRRRVPLFHSQ